MQRDNGGPVPVRDGTLGWLSWHRQVLAAAPVERPRFTESPPDPAAIRSSLERSQHDLAQRHQYAAHTLRYLRPAYLWSVAAFLYAAVGFLIVIATMLWGNLVAEPLLGIEELDADNPIVTGLGIAMLFTPLVAAFAWRTRNRLAGGKRPSIVRRGILVWIVSVVPFVMTFGLSLFAVPAAIALWLLLSRPVIMDAGTQTTAKATTSLWRLYRRTRSDLATQKAALKSLDARVKDDIREAEQAYRQRLDAFRSSEQAWRPFELLPVPERQDLVVVGGTPAERGDLLHHFGAAAGQQRRGLWVLDLEGRDATDRLLAETLYRDGAVRHLRAGDDHAVAGLLDGLAGVTRGKRSALVEVLATGLAYDADGRVTSRARDAADTLRRLARVLQSSSGGVTVARLHAALDGLLGGDAAAVPTSGSDDFGLTAPTADLDDGAALTPGVLADARAAFTQQDRAHFHGAWTDLRIKLETLVPGDGDTVPSPAEAWDAGADLSVTTVEANLHPADRELRTSLLVAHHLELLRDPSGPRPAAVAVLGADVLPAELLRQFSEVAAAAGTQLLVLFGELVPAVADLARGRRVIAAFGGHGAAAAEELAELFGKDWIDRLQSYQESWSASEAISRTETSGRNWSSSDTEQASRQYGSNSSWGSSEAGYNSSHGTSRGKSKGWSHSDTEGGSSSTSDGETSTEQIGGAQTIQRQYERRVTGALISALPPYTIVLKHGDSVRFADVKADLSLPEMLVEGQPPPAPGARVVTAATPTADTTA